MTHKFKSGTSLPTIGGLVMEEQSEKKKLVSDGEYLRARIDLPSFQLDIVTKEPKVALSELRKILEVIHNDEDIMYEEFVKQEIRTNLSTAFVENSQIMDAVKKLLKQEEEYRIASATIPITQSIDVEAQTKRSLVDRRDVRQAVSHLTDAFDQSAVKHGIIHVNGRIGREEKVLILDHIHKNMPMAQFRAFHSTVDEEKVKIEGIFFGDFPTLEEE